MKKALRLPFHDMKAEAWQNLALLAVAIFYAAQVGLDLLWHNVCGHLACDYCAFWSAGHIANSYGYGRVYDLQLLGRIEASISPPAATYAVAAAPIAYLPIFIPPFQLLAELSPVTGYWIWTFVNVLALVLYLRFFVRQTTSQELPRTLLLLCLVSLPVYWSLFDGQVNVWLLICIGESLRASMAGSTWRGGLWLAGLWLKPQLLVLMVPILLLRGAWKMLAGLAATSLPVVLGSWLMVGLGGLENMAAIWLGFSKGMPTNDVSVMMNWRMLGTTLAAISTPMFGRIAIAAGSLATLVVVVYLWRGRIEPQAKAYPVIWTGLLAATTLFAWHSHVHTAMILVPLLLYLTVRKILHHHVLVVWSILPAALYVVAFIMASAIRARLLPASMDLLVNFAFGVGEFGISAYLLLWSVGWTRDRARNSGSVTQPEQQVLGAHS